MFATSHYAILALFFFVGLETVVALQRWIFLLIAIVLGVLTLGILLIRSEENEYSRFHPLQAVLPTIAAISLAGLALFLPSGLLLHAYLFLASGLFFYILKYGAKLAYPTWNVAITIAILYAGITAILGWRFHFYIPPIVALPAAYTLIALLTLQSLWRYSKQTSEAYLLSLTLAFVLSELVWVMQFLPLHYTAQAGIITALYYMSFQLLSISLERSVQKRDILEYAAMSGTACITIFITAQWI